MSERSLFNIRYTFPGYTFLLFVVMMSSQQLWFKLKDTGLGFFTAIFAFIYLLSGAPIGYFVSQWWYLDFHHRKEGYFWKDEKNKKKKKFFEYLCDLVDDEIKLKDNPSKAIIITDYLFNLSPKKKYLESYINRRWDLYNVMGATKYAIVIGYISGFIFNFIILGEIHNFIFNLKELFLYVSLLLLGSLLYIIFDEGMNRIDNEHEDMVDIVIRQVDKNKLKKLKERLGSRANEYFLH